MKALSVPVAALGFLIGLALTCGPGTFVVTQADLLDEFAEDRLPERSPARTGRPAPPQK